MNLPSLIVFDLDACLWTPEMFELSSPPTAFDASACGVRAGHETVRLFPGAQAVVRRLLTQSEYSNVRVAVASSTTEPAYANKCLDLLPADSTGAREERLGELVDFRQIYPGNKGRLHFPALRKESGVNYDQMIFFDDCTYGDVSSNDQTPEISPLLLQVHHVLQCAIEQFSPPFGRIVEMWRRHAKA